MRYFLYRAEVPTKLGYTTVQGVYTCQVYLNQEIFEDEVKKRVVEKNSDVEFAGTPMLTFLYEMTRRETNEWLRKKER
jgi:hypothetical protein